MKAVKLGADGSHLIEYLNATHVGERMKLLHCVSQDTEVLAKMLASAPIKGGIKISSKCARPPFRPLQNGSRKWAGDEARLAQAHPNYDWPVIIHKVVI